MSIKQKLTKTAAVGLAVMISAVSAAAQFTGTHTFYDLSTSTVADGTVSTRWQGGADALGRPLRPDGSTVTVRGAAVGSKTLEVTNRIDGGEPVNWGGLDILLEQMTVSNIFVDGKYSILVSGTIPASVTNIPADAHISMNRIDTWSEVAVSQNVTNQNRAFTLKWEPFAMTGNAFSDFVTVAERANRALRIQTRNAPGMNFTITELVIKVESVEEEIFEWDPPAWDFSAAVPSIKDKYEGVFKIGNIMSPCDGITMNCLTDAFQSTEFFKKHYNVVTLENHMKPNYMMPASNTTTTATGFVRADSVVTWANTNNIDVIGHTLVWHSQSPDWLNGGQGKQPLTRQAAKANMKTYIDRVAGHYAGKVTTWDVVNEAFMNIGECFEEKEDWRDALRSSPCHKASLNLDVNDHTSNQFSPWYDAYYNNGNLAAGEHASDYIYDAFVLTRLADPGAQLYYNDFNEEFPLKAAAIAQMVVQLNEKWKTDPQNPNPSSNRLLIEGIGMQSHYYCGTMGTDIKGTYDFNNIRAAVELFASTGARISITELDIPAGSWSSADTYNKVKLTPEDELNQAEKYAELMKLYLEYKDHIDRITFWGMSDGVSWRASGMPLLFDNSFKPKMAYHAVMNPDEYYNPNSIKPPSRTASSNVNKPNMRVTANRSAINVRFNAANSGETTLKLINLKGNVIATAKMKTTAGKNYSHSFKQKNLPNGFYLVRMQNGNVIDQKRVVLPK